MSKCIIICPLYAGEEADFLAPSPGDLVLCADGGLDAALRAGLRPDLVIGDFDSMPVSHTAGFETLRLPVRKDDTDSAVCLQEGRRRGYRVFRMGGALGGRFDHSLANLQLAADCALRGEELWLCDRLNRLTVLAPGSYRLPRMAGRKLSLLSFTEEVRGVSLSGALWPLRDATLRQAAPLGVSNEWTEEHADLRFEQGLLTVLFSADEGGADHDA